MQQIAYGGEKEVTVRIHRQIVIYKRNCELAFPYQCLQSGRQLEFGDKIRQGEKFVAQRKSRRYAHFCQGPVNQRPHADQTPFKNRSRGPAQREVSILDREDGKRRRIQIIPQFVGKKTNLHIGRLGLLIRNHKVPLVVELRHRHGDRIVETAVQSAEFIHLQIFIPLKGEVRDGLAEIPVIMHYLLHGEAPPHQLAAVLCRERSHLGMRRWLASGRTGYR